MRASHIKTFRGHGSFISSNLVGETHVPRNAPGTPQANARFGRPGRTRGARMRVRRAEETAPRGRPRAEAAQRPGSGRSRVGSASEKRLRERAASGSGEARAWERAREGLGGEQGGGARGDRKVPDKQNAPLAPGRSGRPYGTLPIPGEDPRPPGEPTMRYGPPRPRHRNAAGRSAGTPFLHGVRITRELRRARN